jgi:hypothetical protein
MMIDGVDQHRNTEGIGQQNKFLALDIAEMSCPRQKVDS